jgi:tRNA(Ser,Leu) C12 N-acetylase TAN1
VSEFAEIIDRVGTLQEEAAPIVAQIKALSEKLKPLQKAEEELKAAVNAMDMDADTEGTESGNQYAIEFGKRGTQRKITDMNAVRKLLGAALFMDLAKVNLGDLDKYLTLPQRETVIAVERTSRNYKLYKRS